MTRRPENTEALAALDDNLRHTLTLTKTFPEAPNYRDAIRRKCLDCCVGDRSEVDRCHPTHCAPWPFRFGSNPFRKRGEE